jgi:hypothetical protein
MCLKSLENVSLCTCDSGKGILEARLQGGSVRCKAASSKPSAQEAEDIARGRRGGRGCVKYVLPTIKRLVEWNR